ncbi:DNA-directed RNA polymerase [Emydomyces testavorans]|uniref:DNA-directed RNA polymerase n=1 Tax=Emydomyces testavorans TaxID=2070801 RepID=A0AAF0DFR9_9EURO|nr:DNA-directed RNA polymerase [Emydomyces testavorans]
MLSRAAHRKHAFYQLRRSYDQLHLPWLCPALSRAQSASISTRLIGSPSKSPSPKTAQLSTLEAFRAFATATSDHYIPFEGHDSYNKNIGSEPRPLSSSFTSPLPFSDPSDPAERDASSLIVIKDYLATRPKTVRREKSIGGDANEMLANLDVSLTVGMFDRAALLVRRLSTLYLPGSPEILELHNKYIRMMVSHMILNRRPGMVWAAQRWFEVDMQQLAKVEPDATTFALMLRMALRILLGPRRDRTVRRYWALAKKANVEEDVLGLPILSEADLGLLSEICSSDLQGAALGDLSELSELSELDSTESVASLEEKATLPDVRGTPQKGLGLRSLKDALSLFGDSKTLPESEVRTGYSALGRQHRLERDSLAAAVERWRKESEVMASKGVGTATSEKKLGGLLWDWHQCLLASIQAEMQSILKAQEKEKKSPEDNDRCEYAPFLNAVGAEKLAAVTILTTMNALGRSGMDKGIRLTHLIMFLGRSVQEEYLADRIRESAVESVKGNNANRAKFVEKLIASKNTKEGSSKWRYMVRKYKESHEPISWSPSIEAKVGALLASMLFSSTTVPVEHRNLETGEVTVSNQPAFRHVHQLERGHNIGFVQLHDSVVNKFRKEPASHLLAKHLPMVSLPRPWTSYRDGGFLGQPTVIVRARSGNPLQYQYVKAASSRGNLKEIFAGLNVLGKTGWQINKPVFDVMLEAWNSGQQVADISPADPHLPDPLKPETSDSEALRAYYRSKTLVDNKRSGFHSQRCFQNLQLEIARAYVGETFYLPHNLDFRGRAYPLPPYFNQMGSDMCRGLLLFSEGRELGERGLRWLKIHLANVYGFDKASFDERAQFAMDHLDDVLDSAEKGLHGRKWWLEADDPFQCLAACIELKNALACPDPAKFVSHLPIHQDGSCNGLQHYAALGGDIVGARQVNLEPSDRPSDIYSAVAEHVHQSINQDAAAGNELAKLLQDKINRKIVKQTVMTNVYGVTFLGAIRQVQKQLSEFYPEFAEQNLMGKTATYITRKIFAALSSMFTGAHDIQFWLGDCANRITKSLSPEQIESILADQQATTSSGVKHRRKSAKAGLSLKFRSTVIWTTPLKLPVVQPYREAKTLRVATTMQTFSVKEPHTSDVVSRRKQLQAFPPNFIHSLDATHMMLSAIKCDELGLSFSAVHDSFWTHAADIDTMNRVLRDAFVRMHSEDIVGRLGAEFKARYSNNLYLAKLRPNSAVAKKIIAWRKENRRGNSKAHQIDELLLEYKRLQLLRSTNEAERKEGEAMVTPGSIFAAFKDADASLISVQSLGVAAMGHISPEEAESADLSLEAEEQASSPNELFPEVDPVEEVVEISEPVADKPKKKGASSSWVWLPLTFRPVPSKGEFDVSRLENSQYFFS